MKSVIVSAKFKGTFGFFLHGESYMLLISTTSEGETLATKLIDNGNDNLKEDEVFNAYSSTVHFLIDWEEVTSYPTLSIVHGTGGRHPG